MARYDDNFLGSKKKKAAKAAAKAVATRTTITGIEPLSPRVVSVDMSAAALPTKLPVLTSATAIEPSPKKKFGDTTVGQVVKDPEAVKGVFSVLGGLGEVFGIGQRRSDIPVDDTGYGYITSQAELDRQKQGYIAGLPPFAFAAAVLVLLSLLCYVGYRALK